MRRIQNLTLTTSALAGVMIAGLIGCGDDSHGAADAGDAGGADSGGAGKGGSGGAGSGGSGGSSAGGKGGKGGTGGTGGSAGTGMKATVCGGTECPAVSAQAAMFMVTSCCLDNGGCGVQTPLTAGCLPPNALGSNDSSCPSFDVGAAGLTWAGCCTPEGKCGAATGALGAGCVANSVLMAPESSCSYDASNMCDSVATIECDGAEDCGDGQLCCAHFAGGGYKSMTCQTTSECATLANPDAGMMDLWTELCHSADHACATSGFTCSTSMYVPSFISRCYNTGDPPKDSSLPKAAHEVNCGDMACGAGQKCCAPTPGEPYCSASSEDCRCAAPAGGGDADAGTVVVDAGL